MAANAHDASDKPGDQVMAHAVLWRFGDAEFNITSNELKVAGRRVKIPPRPLQVLEYLLNRQGEVVDRNELKEAVYGHQFIEDNALTNAISNLRRVLRNDQKTIIETVHGTGYRFCISAERITVPIAQILAPQLNVGDVVPGRPHWRLTHSLGQRPSAAVWLAEDDSDPPHKRVFKFAYEVSSLATLKHEVAIGRVLTQTLGARTDIVMPEEWNFEFVPFYIESTYGGISIPEWITQQGGFSAVPLALRIELMAQTAETVAAAHSAGVLHKDLKPKNVLIAPHPELEWQIRVVDFGSGKLVNAEKIAALDLTPAISHILDEAQADSGSGTYRYVAPEIQQGRAPTIQSDIYALGVMLYEMVLGDLSRPLAPGWESDITDELLREDIAAAAEGNPRRRLQDASTLALRLRTLHARHETQRRLAREQQLAAQAQEELAQSRLRRRIALGISAILSVALAIVWVEFQNAERAKKQADHAYRLARDINDFLNRDLFAGIGANNRQAEELTVHQLLDQAAGQVDQRFKDDPEAAAQAHTSLGIAYRAIDLTANAQREFKLALALVQKQYGPASAPALDLAARLIPVDYVMNDLPRTLVSYEALRGPAAQRADISQTALIQFEFEIARAYLMIDRWSASIAICQRLLANKEFRLLPDSIQVLATQILATTQFRQGDFVQAEAAFKQLRALQISTNAGEMAANRTTLLIAQTQVAQGQLEDAATEINKTTDFVAHWEPDGGDLTIFLSMAQASLALARGEARSAENTLRSAIALWLAKRPRNEAERHQLWEALLLLAQAEFQAGHRQAALATIAESLHHVQTLHPNDSPYAGIVVQAQAAMWMADEHLHDQACIAVPVSTPPWLNELNPLHPARLQRLILESQCAYARRDLDLAEQTAQHAQILLHQQLAPNSAMNRRLGQQLTQLIADINTQRDRSVSKT